MSFPAALKEHLSHSSISELVSDRVWPNKRNGATLPAVTYQSLPGRPLNHLGTVAGDAFNHRVQVNVWAESHDSAQDVAAAVRARMSTAASLFRSVCITFEDVYEEDTKLHGVILEFSVWYQTTL